MLWLSRGSVIDALDKIALSFSVFVAGYCGCLEGVLQKVALSLFSGVDKTKL